MSTAEATSNHPNSKKLDWEFVNPEGVKLSEKIALNSRPSTLTEKTVVLTWNHKPNGDIFLDRLAQLLKGVGVKTVIKLWEVDPSTARISKKPEISKELAKTVKDFKPDLVINAQGD